MLSELLGLSREKLSTMSIFDIANAATRKSLVSTLTSLSINAAASTRTWLIRNNGTNFPAILSLISRKDESGKVTITFAVIDDTYNHQVREKFKQDRDDSRRKEQLKNEFIAIASHELRTPIQPILGFALLARKGKISQEQAWEGVLKEARRLQQLANDILDVSRIESNTIAYRKEPVRMNALLKSVIDSFKTDLKKELSISFIPAECEPEIEADRSRITQVISNLVGNSIKFTSSGTIVLRCRTIPSRKVIEITLTDSGPGIPADVIPKLFEKFVTKSHGEALNNDGTGLGLYICKAIVTAHDGKIWAKNNETGPGATFTIELPLIH
jgi:signal transduction histidine kinase